MTLEEFIAELNSKAFFKEFTFSQNKFKPVAGGEYELADNIIWIGDTITILQLKQRETHAAKYDLKMNKCVGLCISKDGDHFLLDWCLLDFAWEKDLEMQKRLAKSNPFNPVKEKEMPRFI